MYDVGILRLPLRFRLNFISRRLYTRAKRRKLGILYRVLLLLAINIAIMYFYLN